MLTLIAMITLSVAALFVIGQTTPARSAPSARRANSIVLGYRSLLNIGGSMRPVEHLRS
ncbi:MAG: hypothetical protein WA892_11345 [Ornithinimicrobium sp.]